MDARESTTPDTAHLAQTLERVHDADVADALNAIDPHAAARVLAALPFELAVRALNQPWRCWKRCRPISARRSSASCSSASPRGS
jgi:Mg/Co/Ni transporter MgtE